METLTLVFDVFRLSTKMSPCSCTVAVVCSWKIMLCIAAFVLNGYITHTVSPNLVLILSTYRVVVHPSYLQKKVCQQIHLRGSVAAPEKQTASTVRLTLGSSGSWTRLSFPHNQKHRSLETFVLSESWVLQLMDMLGAHDPLCWFLPWWRRLHVGMGWWHRWALRNSCLVPYTLQPLKAITPGVNPLKGLGHRDEPFWMERR